VVLLKLVKARRVKGLGCPVNKPPLLIGDEDGESSNLISKNKVKYKNIKTYQ